MQLPQALFDKDNNIDKQAEHGFSLTQSILNDLKANNLNCSMTKGFFEKHSTTNDYADWLEGTMLGYKHFLNDSTDWYSKWTRTKIRTLNLFSFGSNFLDYSFPHISTADQSMYIDQTMALIGLGYKQTELAYSNIREKQQ